jgi:hypothetical protein
VIFGRAGARFRARSFASKPFLCSVINASSNLMSMNKTWPISNLRLRALGGHDLQLTFRLRINDTSQNFFNYSNRLRVVNSAKA